MAGVFDSKYFNGEVFGQYVDRIPNPRKTELMKSRAIRNRPDLASSMRDEVGGNYISTPLKGLISGSNPINYDGVSNITPKNTKTFLHSRVVVGRANAWAELDFSSDIAGGEDFMANVAEQINDYWNEIDQDTLVSILKGIFAMADTEGAKFVAAHTYDITALTSADGKLGCMDSTSLNTAMQRASGDQKGKFTLVIMHSAVATGLENIKLLTYLKYNDENGMERELGIATMNGRLVLVDDSMPVDTTSGTAKYTSFILGDGAIEFTDCGAKVPYEMDRNPAANGGQDLLYSRQRKCWAPFGISFTKKSMATLSPTNAELENGTNWELVHSDGTVKEYIAHKMIPIARVISLA